METINQFQKLGFSNPIKSVGGFQPNWNDTTLSYDEFKIVFSESNDPLWPGAFQHSLLINDEYIFSHAILSEFIEDVQSYIDVKQIK
jgi:hypothetical protein